MISIHKYFTPNEGVLLNAGSCSKSPKSVIAAIHKHVDEYEINPARSLFSAWEKIWQVQKNVATLLGARGEDIFLRPNVTVALNDIILGAKIKNSGPIVVSDQEYGAIVNICEMRAKREKRELITIHLKSGFDAYSDFNELYEHIIKQIPMNASLVMLSHFMTGTGLKIPIHLIGRHLRKNGTRFVVDGAHAPGALPLMLNELNDVDFYAGNFHKWLMGPKGTGFGWVNPVMQSELDVITGGWTTSDEIKEHFLVFGGGSRFALKMLWAHSVNFAPLFALDAMVDFWSEVGAHNIYARIHDLQDLTQNLMQEHLGLRLLTPQSCELRGPLLCYELPDALEKKGFQIVEEMWSEHQVQLVTPVVHGRNCLRLTPHVYVSESEIHRGINAIKLYSGRNS